MTTDEDNAAYEKKRAQVVRRLVVAINAMYFGAFIDYMIDAGLAIDAIPQYSHLAMKWRDWAKSARTPNPAQIDDGESFVYDCETVYARHDGMPLTMEIFREAEMAEYNQALRIRTETRRQKIGSAGGGEE